LDRRLGGPQSRSACRGGDKNSQLLGEFEPQIIQPVAQRYTNQLSRLLEYESADWIYLAVDRIQWQALLYMVMKIPDSIEDGQFLDHLIHYQVFKNDSVPWKKLQLPYKWHNVHTKFHENSSTDFNIVTGPEIHIKTC
jgi:hypothetical protein